MITNRFRKPLSCPWAVAAAAVGMLVQEVAPAAGTSRDVGLVLQITVDGFRGDLLSRYGDRFGEGGFRYLLENGAVYTDAQYQHANTETIVGHTILATGAFPSDHGMVGNVWLDPESGELAYNIEDPDAPLLPTREHQSVGEQVDPAQKLSRTQGRSPVSILSSTFSDELSVFYGGRSKIFSVSGKDRGAVPMAGHAGKAFWYSTDTGDFVTSRYYYQDYPDWAKQWNHRRLAEQQAGQSWELMNEPETYLLGHQDDRPYERDLKGYGRVFPHPYGEPGDKLLNTRLLVSPIGDRLTADFARQILVEEGLGKDSIPDYLGVSFSAVDAVNHFFGPSSLENEDVVLQLDRTLADLFGVVDELVGLERALIVLSADHGMAEMPEYMEEQGMKVGRIYSEDVVAFANAAGKRLFNTAGLVRSFFRPSLYLDDEAVQRTGLKRRDVEQELALALTGMDGISVALPCSGLPAMNGPLVEQIRNNVHPLRSGDIYVAQEPYWFLFEKGSAVAMHGSPWRYDTFVPILFAGAGVPAITTHRRVHPVDIAPTLAAFLGMKPPSSSRGVPLKEVTRTRGPYPGRPGSRSAP